MIQNLAGQIAEAQVLNATTGGAFSGSVTCYVTLDNQPQALGQTAFGVATAKGNGVYNYAPTAAETNGALCAFTFIGVGAIPSTVQYPTISLQQQGALGVASVVSAQTTTAMSLITLAFNTLGLYDVGDSIPNNEMQTAFVRLQQMVSSWTLSRLMAPTLGREVYPLVAGQGGSTTPYTIGPTGNFVTTRPVSIDAAGLLLPATSSTPSTEIPRVVLTDDMWNGLFQKDLANPYFTGVYYQPQTVPPTGNGTIQLWPVPNTNQFQLVIYRLEQLGQFASLTTQYLWPDGYADCVHYNLARRLAPAYGMSVDPSIFAEIVMMALESLATFKRTNTKLNDLDIDPMFTNDRRAGYNILTGNL